MNAETHDLHWHRPDHRKPIIQTGLEPNRVELSTCSECRLHLIRQLPPAGTRTLSLPIPRDWDAAHAEALAEMTAENTTTPAAVDLTPLLADIATIWRDNPTLPVPARATLTVIVSTRAELDALAGDCGQPPPPPADSYSGAQFYVDHGNAHLIVAWMGAK